MAHITRREFLLRGLAAGAAAGGAGFLAPLLSGCGRGGSSWRGKSRPRAILLGIDGLDPVLLRRYMAEGLAPNFAALANQGDFKPLRTSLPAMSPIAWSDMATGANPGQHGIFDFIHRDPKEYFLFMSINKPVTGLTGTRYVCARSLDGFWRYTSEDGVPTAVIRFPITFPAERVSRHMFSGLGSPTLDKIVKLEPTTTSAVQTSTHDPAAGEDGQVSVPLVVERAGRDAVKLSVDGQPPVVVRKGEWTDWLPVAFDMGARRIHGIVKIVAVPTETDMKLWVSPINMDPRRQLFPVTYPPAYGAEMADRLGVFYTEGLPEVLEPLRKGMLGHDEFLTQVEHVNRERFGMLDMELDSFREGLLSFVFDASDRVQHAFWFTLDPQHPAYTAEKAAKYGHVIPDMYRKMDDALGRVLKHADSRTLVLVASDHGFNTYRRSLHLNRWLVDHGFAALRRGADPADNLLLKNIDWSKTRAYAVGYTSLFLNLAGREAEGIVKRGDQAEQVLDQVIAELSALTDPGNGQRVVHKVHRSRDVYRGGRMGAAPDLVVAMNPGWRISFETAEGRTPDRVLEDNTSAWTGDHTFNPDAVPGILLSNRKIIRESPKLMDVAATILDALAVKKPWHMEGQSFLQ